MGPAPLMRRLARPQVDLLTPVHLHRPRWPAPAHSSAGACSETHPREPEIRQEPAYAGAPPCTASPASNPAGLRARDETTNFLSPRVVEVDTGGKSLNNSASETFGRGASPRHPPLCPHLLRRDEAVTSFAREDPAMKHLADCPLARRRRRERLPMRRADLPAVMLRRGAQHLRAAQQETPDRPARRLPHHVDPAATVRLTRPATGPRGTRPPRGQACPRSGRRRAPAG